MARILLFIGFFTLVLSSGLSTSDRLSPEIWGLAAAAVTGITGAWFMHRSMPKPPKPFLDVPIKHYGWFLFAMCVAPFVLRWFNWDGPQVVVLIVIAGSVGWMAAYFPVGMRRAIYAEIDSVEPRNDPSPSQRGGSAAG